LNIGNDVPAGGSVVVPPGALLQDIPVWKSTSQPK